MFAARKTDGAATAAATYIEDVFSTYLYTGNGSAQTIPNSIALGSAYGGSVFFNGGASTALTVSNATAFDFGTGDFTIECWAYVTSQVGSLTIICATEGVNQYWAFGPLGSGGMTMYAGTAGTDIYSGSGSNPSLNQWNHLVWQRSSGVASMYLNGTRVYNASYTADFGSAATGFRIGQSNNYANYYTTGYISNLRVVKGSAVYSGATITVPTSPLSSVANTQLLTCQTPNTVLDYSSNAFTITVTNAVAQNGGGPFTDSTANKGGLVWIKNRNNTRIHQLLDTTRGVWNALDSASSGASAADGSGLTAFNSNGFTIGSSSPYNFNTETFASWTFRKQAKFFDVVTYTGNGANRTIAHNLGSVPGCIIIKRTDTAADWQVYHRSLANTEYLVLNSSAAKATGTTRWNSTTPTSTEFSLGTDTTVNANSGTYVAYLFAHDAGGFGAAGTDNVISCGSVLGGAEANLGYEPQWVLAKASGLAANWFVLDTMRGLTADTVGSAQVLRPNESTAESTNNRGYITSTGFVIKEVNNEPYIYIAIRRGPMKTPTSGTSVFSPFSVTASTGTKRTTGFAIDLQIAGAPYSDGQNNSFSDRLRGVSSTSSESQRSLYSPSSVAEATTGGAATKAWDNTGYQDIAMYTGAGMRTLNFGRAPGFFDIVCDTGTGVAKTVTHNLTVVPELMIRKKRNSATNSDWVVWHSSFSGTTKFLYLNATDAEANNAAFWTSTAPTSSVFSLGNGSRVNNSGDTFVTYLFASVNGVSKVGSYTGNGSSQTINCGFAAGARFILIKRTSSTGDWYVWDTARGIVAGNDPRLSLNTTAAEVTTDDSIDPDNSGFIVNQVAATNINVSAATYIFLAIA